MSGSSSSNREVQNFSVHGIEKDRGTRAVDFLAQVYFLIKQFWIEPRGVMQVVDKDISHMLSFGLAESVEMLAELDRDLR